MSQKVKPPMVGPIRILADFPPTRHATYAGPDWICGPVATHGRANALDEANYDILVEALDDADPNGADWATIQYGHFGVGFIEMVFARPGSKAVAAMGLIRDRLKVSGVLDGERLAEYQTDVEG